MFSGIGDEFVEWQKFFDAILDGRENAIKAMSSECFDAMRKNGVSQEAIDAMCIAYWADGSKPWNDLDEAFKEEMRGGMRDAIEAARAAGVEVG